MLGLDDKVEIRVNRDMRFFDKPNLPMGNYSAKVSGMGDHGKGWGPSTFTLTHLDHYYDVEAKDATIMRQY